MQTNLVNVELTIEQKDNVLMAFLAFKNITPDKLYLDQQTIYYNNEVRNTYFEIFNKRGKEIDYTGMMAKRLILPEDFIELTSGEVINTSVPLNEYYEVVRGKKYTIQYYAFNPSYKGEQESIEMQSNKVEILYQ